MLGMLVSVHALIGNLWSSRSMKSNRLATMLAVALAPASVPTWGADAEKGKNLYTSKCAMCHAADGSGNPGMAKAAGVTLKPLGGPEVQGMSDVDLKAVITAGKGKMKPVKGITGPNLDNLVAYIRTLNQ